MCSGGQSRGDRHPGDAAGPRQKGQSQQSLETQQVTYGRAKLGDEPSWGMSPKHPQGCAPCSPQCTRAFFSSHTFKLLSQARDWLHKRVSREGEEGEGCGLAWLLGGMVRRVHGAAGSVLAELPVLLSHGCRHGLRSGYPSKGLITRGEINVF